MRFTLANLLGGVLLFGGTSFAQDDLTPPPTDVSEAPPPAQSQAQPIPSPPSNYGGAQTPYARSVEPAPLRPEPPVDPSPQRTGFTLEVGLGVSLVQSDETDGDVGVGVAPLSLGVGLFFTSDIALSLRITGASFFQDLGDTLGLFILAHYGTNLQIFVDDDFIVGAGPALSVVGALDGSDPDLGFGFNARAGYALISNRKINIRVLIELLMGAGHTEGTIFAQCLKAEFQLL